MSMHSGCLPCEVHGKQTLEYEDLVNTMSAFRVSWLPSTSGCWGTVGIQLRDAYPSYVICFYLYMSTYCSLQFPFLLIYPKSTFDLIGSALLLRSMFQDILSRLSTLSYSTAFVVYHV